MALSWNELRDDHKIVVLLETLENEKDQQALIACRFCDEIFFDNKSLLNHFQSHFHRDGACNGRILAGSSVPPENSSNSISRSSECTHSSNMPNLSLGKSSVPSFSQIVQLRRGSTLTDHIFASQPNWSLNFNSRFTSEPTGPLDLRSPIRLTSADIFTSDTTTRSTSNFPTAPGTTGLPLRPRRFLPVTARRNEVEGPLFGYTKPYINQLDRPIQKTIIVRDDNYPDQIIDLTLKL
ncbi:hypothetical protein ACS0TY_027018 [Phlomoides rotata]